VSDPDWQARFGGIERLYGLDAAARIRRSSVCVVGLGGVGSWAAEALVRTGVGAIRVVDLDDICISNTNRQSHALDGQVGQFKAEALAARLRLINPDCVVEAVVDFATGDNLEQVLQAPLDGVLDCIDSVHAKTDLLNWCRRQKLMLVSTGGAGGRTDPTRLHIADLNTVRGDALAARVRSPAGSTVRPALVPRPWSPRVSAWQRQPSWCGVWRELTTDKNQAWHRAKRVCVEISNSDSVGVKPAQVRPACR